MERGKRGSSVKRHCVWRKAEPLRPLQTQTLKMGPMCQTGPSQTGLKGPWGVQTGPQLPMTTQLNYSRFYVSGNDARTCHATTLIPSTVDTNTAHCPKSSLMGVWGLCAPRRFALNNNTALIRLVFVALEGWDTLSALGEAPAVIYVLFAPHSF